MSEPKVLLIADVERITRLKRRAIEYAVQRGTFPKPFKILNKNAWFETAIVNWLYEQSEGGAI